VSGNTAIDGDQQASSLRRQLAYGLRIEAIPFAHAMRQVIGHRHPDIAEEPAEHRGGCDPIDIVIAVNGDRFLGMQTTR
jgi:hypothetical protein